MLIKQGADRLPLFFWNTPLLGGLLIYGISALLFILALRGGEVSVLIPVLATNFIWIALLGAFVLGEPMNVMKWFGIIGIVTGVGLVGFGGRR